MIRNKNDVDGLWTVTFGENVVDGLRRYRKFAITSSISGKSYQGTIDNAGVINSETDIPAEVQYIISNMLERMIGITH